MCYRAMAVSEMQCKCVSVASSQRQQRRLKSFCRQQSWLQQHGLSWLKVKQNPPSAGVPVIGCSQEGCRCCSCLPQSIKLSLQATTQTNTQDSRHFINLHYFINLQQSLLHYQGCVGSFSNWHTCSARLASCLTWPAGSISRGAADQG